jgi:hypothetical protein
MKGMKRAMMMVMPPWLEHLGSEMPAYRVVGLVAQDGGQQQDDDGQRQAHQPGAAQGADDEKQRIARQKRHHHQAGLDKDNQEQQGIDPGAIGLHERGNMLVHMQDEVDQKAREFHGGGL